MGKRQLNGIESIIHCQVKNRFRDNRFRYFHVDPIALTRRQSLDFLLNNLDLVDAWLQHELVHRQQPGFAVAMIHDDNVVCSKG